MRAAAAGANGLRFWGVYGVLHIRRRRNVRGRDVVFTSPPGGFGRSAGLPVAYGIRGGSAAAGARMAVAARGELCPAAGRRAAAGIPLGRGPGPRRRGKARCCPDGQR